MATALVIYHVYKSIFYLFDQKYKKRSTCSISVKTSHPALVLFRLVDKRRVAEFGYGWREVLGSNITVFILSFCFQSK